MEHLSPHIVDRVRTAIARHADPAEFRALLTCLMTQQGRPLAVHGATRWSGFVVETCRALGGPLEAALGAAVALEFAVAAADVVDDLVDDEWDEGLAPWPRALNASVALVFLAQRCILELADAHGVGLAVRLGDLLAHGCLVACTGEDMDLRFEQMAEVSEEQAHEMTRRKSGSLVAMACRFGAAVATEEPAVIAAAGEFGEHIGVVAQLLNDLLGVAPTSHAASSDLRRGKKTLPIAYALRCVREEGPHAAFAPFLASSPGQISGASLAAALHDLGALDYTWVVADAHRRAALAALSRLARLTGRTELRRLRRLIPAMGTRRARGPVP